MKSSEKRIEIIRTGWFFAVSTSDVLIPKTIWRPNTFRNATKILKQQSKIPLNFNHFHYQSRSSFIGVVRISWNLRVFFFGRKKKCREKDREMFDWWIGKRERDQVDQAEAYVIWLLNIFARSEFCVYFVYCLQNNVCVTDRERLFVLHWFVFFFFGFVFFFQVETVRHRPLPCVRP